MLGTDPNLPMVPFSSNIRTDPEVHPQAMLMNTFDESN